MISKDYDAYENINKVIDILTAVGLEVNPNNSENNVGHLLYEVLDYLANRIENSRQFYEINDGNGEVFYIRTSVQIKDLKDWLDKVFKKGAWQSADAVEQIKEGFSYHLAMEPKNGIGEWDVYLPLKFEGNTDDAIYEWVKDYFTSTNYIIA